MTKPFEHTISIIKQEIVKHRADMANMMTDTGYLKSCYRYEYKLMQDQLLKYEICLEELKKLQEERSKTYAIKS